MVVDDVLGGRESGLVALRERQRERRQQPRYADPYQFGTCKLLQIMSDLRLVKTPDMATTTPS